MLNNKVSFDQALDRLEEIADKVRKKEVSLEDSLDLLEEGIRLASVCNQHIDYTTLLPHGNDVSAEDDIVAG